MLQRFPVIVGPTAGGKSSVAVALAQGLERLGAGPAEVVTADSMQVYRGMDIGTAKPTADERGGVPHHLIDLVEPTEPFSVDRWRSLADPLIAEIRGRGGVPIVVGGTHFYVKALLEGLFEGPGGDEGVREALRALVPADRRAELERVDPEAAARIHPNDERRTIRALEVFRLTGRPISAWQAQWDRGAARPDALLVGLEWPVEALNRRINARVRSMVERGLVEEARGLWEARRLGEQASQALGYKQLVEWLEAGGGRPEDAIERIKIETRRFAKQQRTWLRRLRTTPASLWLEAEDAAPEALAARISRELGAPGAAGSCGP
jgi:tRNA dimethylallyltransferase